MNIYILLLCILNSILFFNKDFGLNVIIYTAFLIPFIIYVLKKNNKIHNKKGLLFLIPIIILSCTYFLYNNIFNSINLVIIPILYLLMDIYIVNPSFDLFKIINEITALIFNPLTYVDKFFNNLKIEVSNTLKLSNRAKSKIKSFIIVIPITIIVLILLSKADMIFNNLFVKFFSAFRNISLTNLVSRIIIIVLLFTYMGVFINYLITMYPEKTSEKKFSFKIQNYTIKLLLTVLNFIYLVFDYIQIKSLIFHKVMINISYAKYAREGFFELMIISLINLVIILLTKHSNDKENKYNKIMSLIMMLLTLIIIISSFLRMHMYASAYGYTLLRLLVYVTLITEIILLMPTICYIFNSKINILKFYMIIIISAYTSINLVSLDYIIAYKNINRYFKNEKIDLDYLKNNYTDNVSLLIKLYNKTDDLQIKEEINNYLVTIYDDNKDDSFIEFNISKKYALKNVKKFN